MAQSDSQQHAHRILDVVRRGVPDVTSDAVAHSWARCLNQHGLDPAENRHPSVLTRAQLHARQSRMSAVIECARYEMTTLFQQLGDATSRADRHRGRRPSHGHLARLRARRAAVRPRSGCGVERGRGGHERHGHLRRRRPSHCRTPGRTLLHPVHVAHLLGGADLRPGRPHHRRARCQQPLPHAAGAPAGAAGDDGAHDRERADRPALSRCASHPLPQPARVRVHAARGQAGRRRPRPRARGQPRASTAGMVFGGTRACRLDSSSRRRSTTCSSAATARPSIR